MQGFRSPGALQRFSIFSALRNLFVPAAHNAPLSKIHHHRVQVGSGKPWLGQLKSAPQILARYYPDNLT